MSALPPPPPMPPAPPPGPPGGFPPPDATGSSACYRHPNREAFRRCTRCGRYACSECLIQAAIGSQCPECNKASQPAPSQRVKAWNTGADFSVTKVLIVINVAVFLYMTVRDSRALDGSVSSSVARDLGLARFFIEQGEWWRFITSGFIHFGLIHLGFNMFALWNLGQMLEPTTTKLEYGLLYFAALLTGSAGVLIMGGNGITGGASGAVFGLFGAAAVALRQRGINPLQTSIGTVLILNLVLTFTISGISIGGHLGGLVGGAVCGAVVLAPAGRRPARWIVLATPVALAVASVVIGIVVSQTG